MRTRRALGGRSLNVNGRSTQITGFECWIFRRPSRGDMDDALPMAARAPARASEESDARSQPRGDGAQIGVVTAISGSKLSFALLNAALVRAGEPNYERAQVGSLVKIATAGTSTFGFIES